LKNTKQNPAKKVHPSIIIFDIDGVLVGTRHSYMRTVLQTVKHLTGKRVTLTELHEWKNRPGFNDDWKLTHAWVNALGVKLEYAEVKAKFIEFYWGENGNGNASRERWLLPLPALRRLGRKHELSIFTGRDKWELDFTLDRQKTRQFFRRIITVEDLKNPKPSPEGLLKILNGRDPSTAVYLGDNVDDALAAKSADVPFVGVLPKGSEERRRKVESLRNLGARVILGHVTQLESWLKR